jgi:IS5 family transposase
VIERCRRQLNFADGLIAEEVDELWEDWMRQVDQVLGDPQLLETVYAALAARWPKSRTRGRRGTPAEVVLRLLLLKHMRNWSYAILEREVRANLVYRQFTRVGAEKVPDAKTLGRLGQALGPTVIEQIHQRVVAIAQENKIVQGRRLRVDTTVVETDIHHPTDSSLLGDGVRVLTRTMKHITELAGAAGTKLRDRTRSVKFRVLDIARASRSRASQSQHKLEQGYRKLLERARGGTGQALCARGCQRRQACRLGGGTNGAAGQCTLS